MSVGDYLVIAIMVSLIAVLVLFGEKCNFKRECNSLYRIITNHD